MIVKRALILACGVAAMAAAAVSGVVAATFALYAALRPLWGPAWASAAVAGGCCALILLLGLVVLAQGRAPLPAPTPAQSRDYVAQAMDLARERPIVAAAALLALGAVGFRNPKLVSSLMQSFLAPKPGPAKK